MVNTLVIRSFDFSYTVPEKAVPGTVSQTDFVVDGEPLGRTLGFWTERPWFGATRFEQGQDVADRFVQELLVHRRPVNQLGTDCLVLFGCHCGYDYCGVIVCDIERRGKDVIWNNIRHDHGMRTYKSVPALRFDFVQYSDAIRRHVPGRPVA